MNHRRFICFAAVVCMAMVPARIAAGVDYAAPSTKPHEDAPTPVETFDDYDGAVTSVMFSPDGKLLATATVHRTVIVWDWQAKKAVLSLEREGSLCVIMPDSRTLAVSSSGILSAWDLNTGKKSREFGKIGVAASFAPTGNEGELLCGGMDPELSLWDVRTGELTRTLSASHDVRCVAVSASGRFAACGADDGIVRVLNLQTGAEAVKLTDKAKWFRSVAISPDARYVLASSLDDESVRLWDVQIKKVLHRFKASARSARCTAFSPDGCRFMFTDTEVAHLWDLKADREICQLRGHKMEIDAVCFSPDGNYAATAGGGQIFTGERVDTAVRVWRLPQ